MVDTVGTASWEVRGRVAGPGVSVREHGGRLEGKNQQQIFILGMTVTGRARAPRIRRR